MKKLPKYFKDLFWYLDYRSLDPQKHLKEIIIQVFNYGDLKHIKWLMKNFGKNKLKKVIENIPESSFRKPAAELVKVIFGIKKFKYASRSDFIKKQRIISKA